MDMDTIGKVMLILFTIPLIIFLWSCVFAFIDNCFCNGEIQCKIKQWVSRKLEDE